MNSNNQKQQQQPNSKPLETSPSQPSSPQSTLPAKKRKRSLTARLLTVAIILSVLAGIVMAGFAFFGKGMFQTARMDLLTHKVKPELLPVTVIERGTLESADNKDVICKVKAGSKASFASTIRWVIDDGSVVTKNQLVMELDDSALQDQLRSQSIVVEKARAELVKADQEYFIQTKINSTNVATAEATLEIAELDLEKYIGLRPDPDLFPFATVAGMITTVTERGEFRKNLDDVSAQLKQAQSDLESFQDLVAWSQRAVKQNYITPAQSKANESKMEAAKNKMDNLTKQKFLLETFNRKKELTDLRNKVDVAKMNLEKDQRQAESKEVQAESTRKTANSVYQQEVEKLRDIEEQIRECKLIAPQDGMVVYYKAESSRFSQSSQGMISQGEQVKEGQKLIRIPDLKRMQVNTKVHEAMVSRIRGDDRRSTGIVESVRAALLVNPDALTRLTSHTEQVLNSYRELYRDKEYFIASQGQSCQIRVDAMPGRLLKGHVRNVAAVAAQGDWMSSDVKVYQTLVTIDESVEGLKPDMSAEVTIMVDPPKEPVLAVPLQAIVGGAESGPKRKVIVKTLTGTEEREVELGMFNDKLVEIRSGVKDGEEVILNPKAVLGDKAKTRDEFAGQASGQGKGGMSYPAGGAGKGKGPGQGAAGGAEGKKGGMPANGAAMPGKAAP